jgi:hypothetical protein
MEGSMKIKTVAALLALPLLAACAPQVESTIYLSDVQKVLSTGNALATPAQLRIPQSSEDDCKKGLDALVEKVKTLAPVTGKAQCVESDGDELAEITTSLQIVTPKSAIEQPNLLALVAAPDSDGNIALSIHMLRPIDEVVKALASDDGLSTDFDPTSFTMHINNDTGADVDALPGEVMLDGEPRLAVDPPITIAHRQEIKIGFNDVAAAYAERGQPYQFIAVALPK